MSFILRPKEEFLEAVSYYEAQVPGLGERFDAQIRNATALLLKYPEIGPPLDSELRKVVLDRFPHYLIYSVSAETVQIVAVAHERRKPGYWQARAPHR